MYFINFGIYFIEVSRLIFISILWFLFLALKCITDFTIEFLMVLEKLTKVADSFSLYIKIPLVNNMFGSILSSISNIF